MAGEKAAINITIQNGEYQRWATHLAGGVYENDYERGRQEQLWRGFGLVTKCLPGDEGTVFSQVMAGLLTWNAGEHNKGQTDCPVELVVLPAVPVGREMGKGDYFEFILKPNSFGLNLTVTDIGKVRDVIQQGLPRRK